MPDRVSPGPSRLPPRRFGLRLVAMPRITVGTENSAPIEIHYEDHGSGRPIVLIHGYPFDHHPGEAQERLLLNNSFRLITHARRSSGRSTQPATGYGYDTFAADLN